MPYIKSAYHVIPPTILAHLYSSRVRPTIVHFAQVGATVGTHTSHPVGVIQVEGGTARATLQGEALVACLGVWWGRWIYSERKVVGGKIQNQKVPPHPDSQTN